ncbi:MAG: B12-binding domain-containing radical SAM protein [Nitrospirae bacterium]|nr:B12-binding domain-containing radical SAM protein [Nitrospirota bacterium]
MKCLLISLQSNAYVAGLKYLAANIRDKGHDARVLLLPGYLEPTLNPEVEKFIRDYSPDLIGISLMALEFYPSKNLTRLLRERFQIPVIWGGVHATTNPEDCIKQADYICRGEGEKVIVSLLEHLRGKGADCLPEIPGIWARRDGRIVRNADSPPETDLDALPAQEYLPEYYYGFHNNRIYNFARDPSLFRRYALYGGTCHMTITTRGCPFICAYCGNSSLAKVYGREVRKRSVENCIEELRRVKKDPYVLYINFQDDCFFVHTRDWMKHFCDAYKKHINLPFMARVIPSMLDREKLFMLKDAGLSVAVMGVQTGCDRVNFEVYNRKVHFSTVMKAAGLLAESRVAPYYEMIVDNPYETEADIMEGINSMSMLPRPYTVSLAHLTFFPGTSLTERALKDAKIDPEAYLTRFMVNIDWTYFNKLLYMTPFIPRYLIKTLNRRETERNTFHTLFLNSLFFIVKRTIEPAVFFFVIARGLKYNVRWTVRTVLGNWRSAFAKILFNFLGKGDMEFDKRLKLARKEMPSLFEK